MPLRCTTTITHNIMLYSISVCFLINSHTSEVEGFNNLRLTYVPKQFGKSFAAYEVMGQLAALDHDSNVGMY